MARIPSVEILDALRVRLESSIEKSDRGCWLWTGSLYHGGYAFFRSFGVHRLTYHLFKGPIPDGLQIDHLCHVRRCVNPEHLEAVPPKVNIQRRVLKPVTHCVNGHEYTPENTRFDKNGWKLCVECNRLHMRDVYAEKRAGYIGPGKGWRAGQTHCIRGHRLDGDNVYHTSTGRRICRSCARLRKKGVKPVISDTHCPQGHEYTERNTYLSPKGHRQCRECRRLRAWYRQSAPAVG